MAVSKLKSVADGGHSFQQPLSASCAGLRLQALRLLSGEVLQKGSEGVAALVREAGAF